MEDFFASIRHLHDNSRSAEDSNGLCIDFVSGRLGQIAFEAHIYFDNRIGIFLKKNGGRITNGNLEAFWKRWGYERIERFEKPYLNNWVIIVIKGDEVKEMIRATPKGTDRGPVAEVKCDCCGHTDKIRADYERVSADRFEVNEGQVLMKITRKGWSNIKGTLRCPECENKRREEAKPKKEITMKNVVNMPITEEPRQPSREQKRQIITLLTDVYDITSNRYTGGETDKTVAEAIGGGVMLGWVAQIREDLFGPDGGNEDIARLEADVKAHADAIAALTRDIQTCSKFVEDGQSALANIRAAHSDLQRRVDALKASVGPRARNV